jgi:hypothetical protein
MKPEGNATVQTATDEVGFCSAMSNRTCRLCFYARLRGGFFKVLQHFIEHILINQGVCEKKAKNCHKGDHNTLRAAMSDLSGSGFQIWMRIVCQICCEKIDEIEGLIFR